MTEAHYMDEPARRTPVIADVEVLVAGGGLSGTCAALAAAECGARTILVDRLNAPGGNMTNGLVAGLNQMFFSAAGDRIVGSLPVRIVEEVYRLEGRRADWPALRDSRFIIYDTEVMKLALVNLLETAGVEMLFNTVVADAWMEDQVVRGVVVENKSGRSAIRAGVVVDATGDADVAARAGAPFDYDQMPFTWPSKDRGHDVTNMIGSIGRHDTFVWRLGGVDLRQTYEYMLANPRDIGGHDWGQDGTNKDLSAFRHEFEVNGFFMLWDAPGQTLRGLVEQAIARGDFAREYKGALLLDRFGMNGLRDRGTVVINTGVFHIDDLDAREISRAEVQGRQIAFRVTEMFRKYLPGFAQAWVMATTAELGRRLSRRIRAEYLYTLADLAGKRFDDVVGCFAAGGLQRRLTAQIPYRCLVPLGVENLLVASGKSFPMSNTPAWEVRESTACMVQGEAAGTAAALAAASGQPPRELEIRRLQDRLRQRGVYLANPPSRA